MFNAGVPQQFNAFAELFTHPVMLGVMFGLAFGKLIA
jgi:Na+/H+ antiporter NhaA